MKLKPLHIPALLQLLLLGAGENYIQISTKELGNELGKSQQSTSKYLAYLEEAGFIERSRKAGRSSVKVTQEGVDSMNEIYSFLKRIFEEPRKIFEIRGNVFSGLGEGAYYMSLNGYRKQFKKKLGFDPYPGTLNIRIETSPYRRLRRDLNTLQGITIEGFEDTNRTFGGAKCYFARINHKLDAAVLILERTHYDDSVIEIIGPINIRNELNLTDDSSVIMEISIVHNK
jgi:riboflavin kinase